jgi:hypothetical protein
MNIAQASIVTRSTRFHNRLAQLSGDQAKFARFIANPDTITFAGPLSNVTSTSPFSSCSS